MSLFRFFILNLILAFLSFLSRFCFHFKIIFLSLLFFQAPNCALKSFQLSGNELGEIGGNMVATALISNISITDLDLSSNSLTQAVALRSHYLCCCCCCCCCCCFVTIIIIIMIIIVIIKFVYLLIHLSIYLFIYLFCTLMFILFARHLLNFNNLKK